MTRDEQNQGDPPFPRDRRFVWKTVGLSVVVLLVGLGVMYVLSLLGSQQMVGLETLDPIPPALPIEQVAPNRVRLLFTRDGATLAAEMREIAPEEGTYERAATVMALLLEGPRSRRLRSPIPRGATLRGLYLTTGTAVLDLSAELRDGLRGGASAELLCVYGIVNTLLLNCPEIRQVTILVEGRPVETLLGYLDLSVPLVENLRLLAGTGEGEGAQRE